jgi:hypothetical protein
MKKTKKPLVALSKKEQIVGAGGGKEGLNPRSRSGSKPTTKAPVKKLKEGLS